MIPTKPATLEDQDFSLVLGGPLFQLFRRAHLTGGTLELVQRRVLVISCVAWVPLLLLSALAGHALPGTIEIPFLHDIEAHARFLVALPMLIVAELVVHLRIRPVVEKFVERRIVRSEDVPAFRRIISSILSARNSPIVEVGLIALVYTVGLWVWKSQIAFEAASWYAIPDAAGLHLTAAGYWYAFVSVPLFQFILLRWYFRFLLWFWFLLRVSKLKLHLVPTHPDRAAGLGFLGKGSYAFAPVLFAQSALLAGLIASQIFHAGRDLMSFKMQIVGFVAFFVAVVLAPLTVFTPSLLRAKRQGLGDYGGLASRYVLEFEEKWVAGDASLKEPLLGSGDIQSLADLGNSYAVVQEMRPVPFGVQDITRLAAGAALPLLPLTLTVVSLEELVTRLIKVLL